MFPGMNYKQMSISPRMILIFAGFLFPSRSYSQHAEKTDSVIKSILGNERLTDVNDHGITLMKDEKYSEANLFYSEQIKKDEGNKEAYFNRGVANWAMNDASHACRDWSAVLALGDTATFKLLDKNCHGTMIIEDDTLPIKQYHRMWKGDDKTLSANSNALNVSDEMPQFPKGDKELLKYFSDNIKYPAKAKQNTVQGTVYINFIVSRKGKVLFPYVVRGIGSGCDEEALRIIRNMPAWIPGKQKGKPVLVRYNLPVRFKIK